MGWSGLRPAKFERGKRPITIVSGERERAIGLPASAGLQGTLSQSIIEVGTSEQVQPVICSQLKLSGCIVFLVGSGRPEPFWVAGSTCGAQERLELSLRKSRVRPEWAMCHCQCTRGHRLPDGRISREATAGLAEVEVNRFHAPFVDSPSNTPCSFRADLREKAIGRRI
jgi:hypothetical protein